MSLGEACAHSRYCRLLIRQAGESLHDVTRVAREHGLTGAVVISTSDASVAELAAPSLSLPDGFITICPAPATIACLNDKRIEMATLARHRAALPRTLTTPVQGRLLELPGAQATRPRLLSATSRNLPQLIARGQFREELFYRLAVTRIEMPPLSQRREDIPLLAAHFLEERATRTGTRHVLAPEAVEVLIAAEWPGNISQLSSLMEQAASLTSAPVISAELVQRALGGTAASVPSFDEARDEFTRNYLAQLLQLTRGNVTQAAKLAGRTRTDFYKLLGRHQVSPDEFKAG